MATSSGNAITDWKRLWQLVSGIHHETPENTVLEELLNVSKELQDGLLQFKATSSSKTNLESLLKEKKQEKLLPFTQRLQELLNLESIQCWEILCYYLSNEYRGSASSLTTFISTESNMTKLLDDIWGYYTLERMIVLKIVKNLLVFYKSSNHPYQREYKQIVEKITLSNLRDSYIKQLEHLVNEVPPTKLTSGEFFNYQTKLVFWSERNIRETTEILHILLLIFEHLPVEVEHFKRIFSCFKHNSFGKQQCYLNPNINLHAELMTRTAYSEIVLFIKSLDFENPKSASALAQEIIKSLDKDISRMYHNPENGPILFSWMLLNMRCTNIREDEDSLMKYRQFGKRALDLNCFEYLRNLVSNPMFKDDSLVSRIVRKTIYNQLKYMCDLFDADGSCARHPFVYELLCELISWPTLAKDFCSQEEGGVRSLYTTLLETFPIDFTHMSMVALALTKGGMGDYIYSQLEAMPILTDLYDDNKFSIEAIGGDEYVLNYDYKPFRNIEFKIAAGATAAVMERHEGFCVHFRADVNYFNILHNEINCLLDEAIQLHTDFQSSERLRRVNAGLKYLESALQRTKTLSAITVEMVHPTEMTIDLLNKFKTVQCPPLQLMSTCLNVCTALLPLVDTEIFTRVTNLNIFPVVTNDTADYKKYSHGFCFDSGLVGTYLVDFEKKLERYDFLLAYLSFLRTYTKMQKNNLFQVEIPGLIFLLREVFPHMQTWRFRSSDEKNKIYAEIMGFICDILDAVTLVTCKDEKDKYKCLLRDICVYSLLNSDNGFMLLKFIAVGNAYLQHTMELESNWMQQQTHGLMLLVRLSMRILMQLLRLKATIYESTELSPLESLIYTQPKQRDTLRIIPVVTSYMSNIFDRWLPLLSCRLLKRIALEFNMSLLSCLDMEPDQIRLTFLQKLPDEFESDSLKIAILELVESCIKKQPGVTEALFKVNFANEKRIFGKDKETQIADSFLTFMEDYLEAVEKEPNTVQNTLPSRIMNIFHSLWKHNMQILVEELAVKPKFWQQLCKPLFSELSPNVRAYTQLLNIIGIEIFCSPNKTHTELKKEIIKLFDPMHFENLLDCVFNMPQTPTVHTFANSLISEDTPEWLSRLQAFKDFLVVILNKQQQLQIEIPQKQLKLLAERCFTILVERSLYVADLRPFIILSEMYLFILLNFKHAYTESEEEDCVMLKQLIQLLGRVASCYEDLHIRAKEACLAITIKCSDLLAGELMKDSSVALSYLHSVVSIICLELQNLENCVKAEVQAKTTSERSSNSLVLSLNLLKTIAVIFHNDGPGNWDLPFIANKLFQRLLSCTGSILQMCSKQKLSLELLDVLIVFAKGNCSAEFLYCDVSDYLWLKMLPPKELLQVPYNLGAQRTDGWSVQKWWPIYTRGIELLTILLQKHKYEILKDVLQFVGIHEEYLMDSLLLGKQSLETLAMELIKCAVTLISNLVIYEKQWRLENAQSLFNLMRCVQMLMGHSISMFHQPKNLKFLITGRRAQPDILREVESGGFVDEIIIALNDLTEIIIICARCLQKFSPDILELICDVEFLKSKWEPIFEINFGAPKLNENAMTLTFGTVLSVVGVYTKALSLQNYVFHETPLNILPIPVDGDNNNAASHNTTIRSATAPRPFSKSLSVTSVSSANCPSNELLSNLDGELCLMALEHILFLAASQSMLALKDPQLPPREKQLIRREISTELIAYHEFVRKKVLIDFREHKEMWHRRKHGQVFMLHLGLEQNRDNDEPSTSSAATARNMFDKNRRASSDLRSMRVNVVRRLHLQQQHRSPAVESFEATNIISPSAVSSTPNSSRPAIRRQGEKLKNVDATKRVHMASEVIEEDIEDIGEEDEIEYFPPEEPKYSPLSYIQLVEEDYLHFMSNLFTVICQSE